MSPNAIIRIPSDSKTQQKHGTVLFQSRDNLPMETPHRSLHQDDCEVESVNFSRLDETIDKKDSQQTMRIADYENEAHHYQKLLSVANRQVSVLSEQNECHRREIVALQNQVDSQIVTIRQLKESKEKDEQEIINMRQYNKHLLEQLQVKDQIIEQSKMSTPQTQDNAALLKLEKRKMEKYFQQKITIYENQMLSLKEQYETLKNVKCLLEKKCAALTNSLKEYQMASHQTRSSPGEKENKLNHHVQHNHHLSRETQEAPRMAFHKPPTGKLTSAQSDFEVHSEPAVHQESQKAMHEAIHQLKSYIVDLDNYYRHRLADLEYENRALVDKMRSGLRVERSQPENQFASAAYLSGQSMPPPAKSRTWFESVSPSYRSVEATSEPVSIASLEARQILEIISESQRDKEELAKLIRETESKREQQKQNEEDRLKFMEEKLNAIHHLFVQFEQHSTDRKIREETPVRQTIQRRALHKAMNEQNPQRSAIPPLQLEGRAKPSPSRIDMKRAVSEPSLKL